MDKPIKLTIGGTSKRVDIANVVALTFFNNIELPRQSELAVRMGWRDSELGGTGPAILVGNKKCDFGFGNPVGLSAMAYLGCGFYKKKIPLRAIGVFPTWDRLIFAVRKDIGVDSLEDVKKQKYPLRISTRRRGKLQTTIYAIEEVLKAYGMSYRDIERWGGKIMEAPNPSGPDRKDHIQSGKADAVFDEGVKSWGPTALNAGMCFLANQRCRGAPYEQAGISQRHADAQALRQARPRHSLRRLQRLDVFLSCRPARAYRLRDG